MTMKFWAKVGFFSFTAIICAFGIGRIYFAVTAGFTEGNIAYDLPFDSKWEVTALDDQKKAHLDEILSQEFYYLDKGCQSYVFSSKDDKYVIKFFKYQRFRPQFLLEWVSTFPFVKDYYRNKVAEKKGMLSNAFGSWKLAYESLRDETGVLYVHFNKRKEWEKSLIVYDKMGLKHSLNLNELEFMVQKKGDMLSDTLLKFKACGRVEKAKLLVDKLLALILSEYARGYADNDHALLQNTGVFAGEPIHIDVGQFVKNSIVKDSDVYNQELFNKMWRFRLWLQKEFVEIHSYLNGRLEEIIGSEFSTMKPLITKGGVGGIPFEQLAENDKGKKM